ncbi:MAG TPA: hypothetical protein VFW09_15010 [Solirubrobacteraceae bacterium]|nr:hypothetical protein [Solirubrobacteraceae bacterium]
MLAAGATIAGSTAGATARVSNRALAHHAAAALLRRTPRPTRSRRVATEPRGGGHLLTNPSSVPATRALVDRHAFYVVRAPLHEVERFYARHRPRHARQLATGTSAGPGVPRNHSLTWGWPTRRALVSRQTLLEMVALGRRRTGVRVDAQVVWRVPRPDGERVPAGVRAITITRTKPGHLPDLTRNVRSGPHVRAIIEMIDRLPIVQPDFIACPVLLAGTPVVTFSFRSSRAGPALATASEPADVTEPTNACDALTFATGTHTWPSLLHGARFLHRVDRLLHAHFATRPGATARGVA